MTSTNRKSWARNLLMCTVVRFDLWPLLQGQTRRAKFKSAYNSLIFGHRGLVCEAYSKSWARNLVIWSGLTLDPFFKVK